MIPEKPFFNPAHGITMDSVLPADTFMFPSLVADGADLFWRQLASRSAVTLPVGIVLTGGAPAQVLQAIVGLVAVVVATFFAVRPWPNKGFKDETVDTVTAALTIFVQLNPWVSRVAKERFQHSSGLVKSVTGPINGPRQGADGALVTDLVPALKAGHGLPCFHWAGVDHWQPTYKKRL